ncbi:hypothetical protein GV794_17270 [Nocardia cyriacigeorgica]|uniref:Uncharacterized protein n=1 Tax=Nocardia cyriacigeorgica TaxID=135487 RepID=A0ABX0CUB3_9NOCA|nr:hypothetical protein [Nocardia cyriacigeorgica]NEW57392.1 hypothetical protein [Nocardia cyriacigeorgica]
MPGRRHRLFPQETNPHQPTQITQGWLPAREPSAPAPDQHAQHPPNLGDQPSNGQAGASMTPVPPPPMPGPPAPGIGARQGNQQRGGSNGYARSRGKPGDGQGSVLVQPFAGFGVAAEFNPSTGALQAVPAQAGAPAGVYGDLGESKVVFYRNGAGLALRVDGRTIELDGPVDIEWGQVAYRTTRFAVIEGGVVVFEAIYRSLPPEMDLGALVHGVLADPERRAAIFPGQQ